MNMKNNLRKKIGYIVIILTLLFSTVAALTPLATSYAYTHAVLAEYASNTG